MWRKLDQLLWFYVWDNLHTALTWVCWSLARAVMAIPQIIWALRGWDSTIILRVGNLFERKQSKTKVE